MFNKGKEAKKNTLNAEEINQHLKGGMVNVGDKNVTIEIETQVIQVKNRREAEKSIDKNGGYGVIVKNSSRFWNKNRRVEHIAPVNEGDPFDYDEIRIYSGKYNLGVAKAHEVGHDLGFSEKYADVKGEGSLLTKEGVGGLMGFGDNLSEFELETIANHLIENGLKPINDRRAVDKEKDKIPLGQINLFKVQLEISTDGKLKILDIDFDAKKVDIKSNKGVPKGKIIK